MVDDDDLGFSGGNNTREAHGFVRGGVGMLPYKSKVNFLCGNQAAPWPHFEATGLVATAVIISSSLDTTFLRGVAVPMERLYKVRKARSLHIPITYLELLQMFRQTECSDPRDKVYAPLCLAPQDIGALTKPDYARKSTMEVYRDVVHVCLKQSSNSLDFLGYAMWIGNPTSLVNSDVAPLSIPSWIPNWHEPLDIEPIPKTIPAKSEPERREIHLIDRPGFPSYDGDQIQAFRASGDSQSHARIEDTSLHLRGICCKVVEDIGSGALTYEENLAKETRWRLASNGKYVTGEPFRDTVQRTQAMDPLCDGLGRPSERGGFSSVEFLRKKKEELTEQEYQWQIKMGHAKRKAHLGRTLGRCEGGWMAMLPQRSKAGDGVWALLGGKVLYVLRREGDGGHLYRLIGETYVHGLMDGEAMRRVAVGEAKVEDVILI
ncbi:hypothetical protein MMC18_002005 [Xylographa bjoerkii]|nr:hypothetical protein [Xylographa bjoerkii]